MSLFEAFLHIKAFSYLPYRALAPPVTTTSPSPNNGDGDEELEKLSTDHRHPQRNEDGSPVLRTTKKWQALKKCLVLSDLWRELKEETVFVASRKRREEALMDRAGDLEEAMGRARTKTSKQAAFEEELWGNSIERGIKKAKEKEENVRRGVKIAEDGSIIYPSSKKPNKMFDPGYGRASNEEGRSLLRGGDDTTFSFYQIERPVQQHIPFAEESITDFPTSLSPSRPLIAARRGSGPPRPLELRLPPPLQLPTATQENVTSSSSVPSHSSSPPNPSLARTSTFGAPTRRSHIRRHSAVPLPSPSSTNFTPTRNSFDSISQPYTHNHDQPTSPPPFVLPSPLPSSVQRNVTGLSASASRHVTRHSTHLEQQSVQSLKVFASEQSKRSQGLPRGAAPPVWSSGR